jgi:hypothetical protein
VLGIVLAVFEQGLRERRAASGHPAKGADGIVGQRTEHDLVSLDPDVEPRARFDAERAPDLSGDDT